MTESVTPDTAKAPDPDAHHKDSNVRPAVGVGVMVRRGDQVLLGRRRGAHGEGAYGWPGGGLGFGESLYETVCREAMEEAGLTVHEARFVCISNVIEYGRHYLDITYEVTNFSGEPQARESDYSEAWAWYSIDDLPHPLFRPCELALESIRSGSIVNDSDHSRT